VEIRNRVQHGWRSSWSDDAQRPAQGPNRSEPVATAVLPRRTMRLLHDQRANLFACSIAAARFESIKSAGAITNSPERPHLPAVARARSVQAGSGLAAWQQLVVAAYIEKHLGEPITVRELARFVYLSSSCFCRRFRQSFGIPPHRYLVRCRIERAKALLASSGWSTTDIGLALGFDRTSSFSTAYRNVTGVTPAQFRSFQR
jgi:AraC-like DNA-binding protein